MARRTVTVKGMDQLRAKLDQLPDAIVTGVRAAVKAETEEIADDMRRGAPRATGELADSMQTEIADDGLSGKAVATARHATFVEHGTSDTPAQPYVAPAAERARKRFPGRVEAAIGGELRKLLK
jgi:HK97 gp10 family phage protein